MRFPPYDWSPLPDPQDRGFRLKIERAPVIGHLDYGILSERVTGVFLHWDGRRNVGCVGPDYCEWCKGRKGRKWRGYLACRRAGVRYVRLLEVTADMIEGVLLAHPAIEAEKLRGLTVRASRMWPHKKAPPCLSLLPVPRWPEDKLDPCPDVQEELHRIWTSD